MSVAFPARALLVIGLALAGGAAPGDDRAVLTGPDPASVRAGALPGLAMPLGSAGVDELITALRFTEEQRRRAWDAHRRYGDAFAALRADGFASYLPLSLAVEGIPLRTPAPGAIRDFARQRQRLAGGIERLDAELFEAIAQVAGGTPPALQAARAARERSRLMADPLMADCFITGAPADVAELYRAAAGPEAAQAQAGDLEAYQVELNRDLAEVHSAMARMRLDWAATVEAHPEYLDADGAAGPPRTIGRAWAALAGPPRAASNQYLALNRRTMQRLVQSLDAPRAEAFRGAYLLREYGDSTVRGDRMVPTFEAAAQRPEIDPDKRALIRSRLDEYRTRWEALRVERIDEIEQQQASRVPGIPNMWSGPPPVDPNRATIEAGRLRRDALTFLRQVLGDPAARAVFAATQGPDAAGAPAAATRPADRPGDAAALERALAQVPLPPPPTGATLDRCATLLGVRDEQRPLLETLESGYRAEYSRLEATSYRDLRRTELGQAPRQRPDGTIDVRGASPEEVEGTAAMLRQLQDRTATLDASFLDDLARVLEPAQAEQMWRVRLDRACQVAAAGDVSAGDLGSGEAVVSLVTVVDGAALPTARRPAVDGLLRPEADALAERLRELARRRGAAWKAVWIMLARSDPQQGADEAAIREAGAGYEGALARFFELRGALALENRRLVEALGEGLDASERARLVEAYRRAAFPRGLRAA